MREQTVAMYCVLDDLIRFTRPAGSPLPASGRRLTDAQVLTTALMAARFFGGNRVVAKHYREQHWGQNQLDKRGFTRRLHALTDTLHTLFATFGDLLKNRHTEARYLIDSFPVAGCHNTRIPRCKLLTGKAYHGRCASKRCWFYGLKVQVVTTSDGVPVEFHLHAGAEADSTGLRGLPLDLPEGSVLDTRCRLHGLRGRGRVRRSERQPTKKCAAQKQQAAPPSSSKLSDSVLSQGY